MHISNCIEVRENRQRRRANTWRVATIRPLIVGVIAFFLLTGADAKAPPPATDQARLWIILIMDSDLKGGLNTNRVQALHNSFPHHDAVLRAGINTDVTLSPNFMAALKGVLELPEKPGAEQFLVLFAFQWVANSNRVELSRSPHRTLPDHPPWSSPINGAKEWYVSDRVAALDPTRGLQWRLTLAPGRRFDFTPVPPGTP